MISRAVASLADSALLMPASLLLVVYLGWQRQGRLLAAWLLALAIAGGGTLASKLLFHACGSTIAAGDVTSPSGHASFAVIFYGSLALMLGRGRSSLVRWAMAAGTALLVIGVGISRVRTEAHTPAEVGIGIAIGMAALVVFAALRARGPQPVLPLAPVFAGFAVALLLLGGAHFSLENRIGQIARRLSAALDVCIEGGRNPSGIGQPPGR